MSPVIAGQVLACYGREQRREIQVRSEKLLRRELMLTVQQTIREAPVFTLPVVRVM